MNKFTDKYFSEVLISGFYCFSNDKCSFEANYHYGKLKDDKYGFVIIIDVGGYNMGTIIPTDKNIMFTDEYEDYLNYALKLVHRMLRYTFKCSDREYSIKRK